MREKKSVILFVIGFISALGYIVFHNVTPLSLTMVLKILPTMSMCIWMLIKKIDKINWSIFVGIVLSLLCDVFMLLNLVTIGMGCNMIALAFYTIYFIKSDPSLDISRLIPFTVLLTAFYIFIQRYLDDNRIPVLIYCILYIIFLWRSSARIGEANISKRSQWVCFWGCVSMTVSDLLLSLTIFNVIDQSNILYTIVMIFWWSGLYLLMFTAELKKQVYLKLTK